jgi:hypothetical protein
MIISYHLHIVTVALSHLLTATLGSLGLGFIVLGALICIGGYLAAEYAGENVFRSGRSDSLDKGEIYNPEKPPNPPFTIAELHRPQPSYVLQTVVGDASVVVASRHEGAEAATDVETVPLVARPGASVL